MMTRFASTKLRATPPALSEMRKTVHSGSSVKALIVLSRAVGVMVPWIRTNFHLPSWRRRATRSL